MPERLETNERHRRMVLKALLWTTLVGGVFFSILNTLREIWLLVVLEGGYACFSLFLLCIIDRTPHLRTWTLVYLLPFFSIMMVSLLLPKTSFAVFAWIQTIPIICYLLLGLHLGFRVAILFIGIGLLAFNYRYISDDYLTNITVIANISLASLAMLLFSHIYERSRLDNEQRLLQLASTDSLTGLANRTKLSEVFQRESAHAQRAGSPLALVFLDIDHFKQINDQHGHDSGDQALCHLVRVLRERLRNTDLFCRLGGEEFAVLLPHADMTQATEIAENLRLRLAASPLMLGETALNMTLSAGVACLGADGTSLDQLMKAADRRTYAAKHTGRNRVIAADEPQLGELEPAR
ncbi:GGDEF domain-containing protein [Pseudomonas sp. UBA2684]|uniref:GGDEF domain-containing protein n=1 Tax=Pseudomonas sp. UBA2684 TaxID=1947311 RepID=UPI000E994958|nr:GGDEF domain-containing protein [Pseudomonas sp. UBA2684]HBX57584.1 GGDEF domain-containing protein [Pseudomonas sp.]|tara:strand:+ start:19047 stop:20099 length:1053 start_codon:yes stop_codon:yes gene_type:complete